MWYVDWEDGMGLARQWMNTYMERTIRVWENAAEVAHNEFPVSLSGRKVATIWGDCNREYIFFILNGGDNGREC